MDISPVRGLWCATLTPLDNRGNVDVARLADHVRDLFAQGVDGVAPFGTTGEFPSFTIAERMAGLEALLAAGIPASRIVPGTGDCEIGQLERQAFYARARDAFIVVRTGELRPYGNILLVKGVVNGDAR